MKAGDGRQRQRIVVGSGGGRGGATAGGSRRTIVGGGACGDYGQRDSLRREGEREDSSW